MWKGIIYIIMTLFLFSCGNKQGKQNDELLVFCAASLTNVMSEIAEAFELQQGIDVQLNFASSGTLARQIEHGAQPEVYLSANEKWVDYLNDLNLVVPETKRKVAGSELAVIIPLNSPLEKFNFDSTLPLKFEGRLAMGDPKHVPAGNYTQQAISNAGLEQALKNRIFPAKDVRSALMVVEMGEVEMGIVYKTDALKSEKVKIVAEVPQELYPPIGFYTSILMEKNTKQSQLFYNFLTSKKAKAIWVKNGFTIE